MAEQAVKEQRTKNKADKAVVDREEAAPAAQTKGKDKTASVLNEVGGKKANKRSSPLGTDTRKVPTPVRQHEVVVDVHQSANVNDRMLAILQTIQQNQNKQGEDIASLAKRMTEFESYYEEDTEYQNLENDETHSQPENEDEIAAETENEPPQKKQKTQEETVKNSRFLEMSRCFRIKPVCDVDIDSVLADTITTVFRDGIEEAQYQELTKDETTSRPGNCEGLVVVKTNQLVWDIISPEARTVDRKMQSIETAVVKAATILAKVTDKLADSDTHSAGDFDPVNECNNVLALMGHANRQINLTRRDFIRPELRSEYLHLCAHSVPYTDKLFGDDVSKTAKQIEDCSKMSSKLQSSVQKVNSFRGRKSFRGRNTRGRGSGRGRMFNTGAAATGNRGYNGPKNQQKPQRGRAHQQ